MAGFVPVKPARGAKLVDISEMASSIRSYMPQALPLYTADLGNKRRPLAQGRLVKNGSKSQQSDSDVFHKLEQQRLVSSPRAKLQSRVVLPADKSDPRIASDRGNPMRTDTRLDLSDSDQESTDKGGVSELQYSCDIPTILVVDAPHFGRDLNASDVSTMTGYARSPVKVICHSPRVPGSGTRGSRTPGKVRLAAVVSGSEPHHHGLSSLVTASDQNLHSDGVGMTQTKEAVEVTTPPQRPLPVLPASPKGFLQPFLQPNFDDSLKSLSPGKVDQSKIGSDCSDDLLSVTGNSTRNQPSPVKGSKKKKGRIISSRYMQTDKSKTVSGVNSLNKNSARNVKLSARGSGKSLVVKSSTKSKTTAKKAAMGSYVEETPMASSQPGPASGKTSTPTHEEVSFFSNIDASAITAENTSVFSTSVNAAGDYSYKAPVKKITREEGKATQLDLDYARYLMWCYLDGAARKSLQEQGKSAMAQLYALWMEVESLRQTETQKKRSELQLIQHANLLEEQLHLQKTGLAPVIKVLPELSAEHGLLARALDTTRHQIPATDVHLPHDQDTFQESLISALRESEGLLGELSVLTRQHTPTVTQYSKALGLLGKTAQSERQSHRQCQRQLAAVNSLTTVEASLKIHHSQDIGDPFSFKLEESGQLGTFVDEHT